MKNVFTKQNILTVVGIVVVVLVILYAPPIQKQNLSDSESGNIPENVGIANPASQACVEKGYTLDIRKDEGGNETGFCVFSDGTECEEWAFFRGECAYGGGLGSVKDEKYAGCPEWVNCMPGPDLPKDHCVVPPECEGYTQRAY